MGGRWLGEVFEPYMRKIPAKPQTIPFRSTRTVQSTTRTFSQRSPTKRFLRPFQLTIQFILSFLHPHIKRPPRRQHGKLATTPLYPRPPLETYPFATSLIALSKGDVVSEQSDCNCRRTRHGTEDDRSHTMRFDLFIEHSTQRIGSCRLGVCVCVAGDEKAGDWGTTETTCVGGRSS